jgi:hypothetical protein
VKDQTTFHTHSPAANGTQDTLLCTLSPCHSDAKKEVFFFFTHRRRRSNTPARSQERQERIPAVQSNSGGTYTTTTALYSERYFSKCITTKTSSILLRTAPVRSGLGLPFPFDSPSEYLLLLLVASDSTGRQEQQGAPCGLFTLLEDAPSIDGHKMQYPAVFPSLSLSLL